jgi:catechol 2,3-dioxygenase
MSSTTLAFGKITLSVHNLEAVGAFYQHSVGLQLVAGDANYSDFGVGNHVLLTLRRDPAARRHSAREPGLFHTAFLLPDRADLGRWMRHAIDRRIVVAGASDHGVSEAAYLTDPEGNGVEIYTDRPRLTWRWNNGEVDMPSDALKIEPILAAAEGTSWAGFPAGSRIGHMHLQVGDIVAAEAHYRDVLGFSVTSRYPGGTFYAVDGYHHHLATNVWNSRRVGPRELPSTGLADIEMLASRQFIAAIEQQARGAGRAVTMLADGGLSIADPWKTNISFKPASPRQDAP